MAQIRLRRREADGDLPNVCMCCGEPAAERETHVLYWHPRPLILLFFLTGPVVYAIVAILATKRAFLQAPFCQRHRGHWYKRRLLIWSLLTVFALAAANGFGFALGAEPERRAMLLPIVGISSFVLFLVWIALLVLVEQTTICTVEITASDIVLDGVCKKFARAISERDRVERTSANSDGDDPGHVQAPGRKAPSSEAVEE